MAQAPQTNSTNISDSLFVPAMETDEKVEQKRKEYERIKRSELKKKIRLNDDTGLYEYPIAYAVDMSLDAQFPTFLKNRTYAKQHGVTMDEAQHQLNANRVSPKSNVVSTAFIGGNGIGKTDSMLPAAANRIKKEGMNPIIFRDFYLLKDYDFKDDDVLMVYFSCVGVESYEIRGIPSTVEEDRPLYIEGTKQTKEVEYIEDGEMKKRIEAIQAKFPTLRYSEVQKFALMQKAKHVMLFLDERNRAMDLSFINAIIAGEPTQGFSFPQNMMVMISENSSSDDRNLVNQVDAAGLTKSSIVHVFQTAKEWSIWAHNNNIHPSVIGFALANEEVFENQIQHTAEVAFPTFRGLVALSNELYNLEKTAEKNGDKLDFHDLQFLAQSTLGTYGDGKAINVARKFSEFYLGTHLKIIHAVESKLSGFVEDHEIGFGKPEENAQMLEIMREKTKNGIKFYDDSKFRMNFAGTQSDEVRHLAQTASQYFLNYMNAILKPNSFLNAIDTFKVAKLRQLVDLNDGKSEQNKIANFAAELDLDANETRMLKQIVTAENNVKGMPFLNAAPKLSQYMEDVLREDLAEAVAEGKPMRSDFASVLESLTKKITLTFSTSFGKQEDYAALSAQLRFETVIKPEDYGYDFYKQVFPVKADGTIQPMDIMLNMTSTALTVDHPYLITAPYAMAGLCDKNEELPYQKAVELAKTLDGFDAKTMAEFDGRTREALENFREICKDSLKNGKLPVDEYTYNNLRYIVRLSREMQTTVAKENAMQVQVDADDFIDVKTTKRKRTTKSKP